MSRTDSSAEREEKVIHQDFLDLGLQCLYLRENIEAHLTALPKGTTPDFGWIAKKDGIRNFSSLPTAVTGEKMQIPDFCEMPKDDLRLLAVPPHLTRGTKVRTMDFEEIPKKTDFENLSVAACMATTEKFQIPDFRKTSKDTFGLLSLASHFKDKKTFFVFKRSYA